VRWRLRQSARQRDEGFSLVETIVSVSLLGLAATSILGGLSTSIRVSRMGNDKAKVEAVLSSAADRLAGWSYLACPLQDVNGGYLPVVQAASSTVNWPASTVQISSIAYWEPASPSAGTWQTTNGVSCNNAAGLTTSRTLQRVTIRVTAPDGRNARTLEVVKNNVFPNAAVT
jgi:type II secretory pathway pseudopilin PulG